VIFVVVVNDYRNTHVSHVLDGPAEPGIDALLVTFHAEVLGLPEAPKIPAKTADLEDYKRWNSDSEQWRRQKDRLVAERFGGTHTAPSWEAYWEGYVAWLCAEQGYREAEHAIFDI
jgi:hypothetical protein